MKAGRTTETGRTLLQPLTAKETREIESRCRVTPSSSTPNGIFLPSEVDRDICHEIRDQHDDDHEDTASIGSHSVDEIPLANSAPKTYFCENEGKTVSVAFRATKDIPPGLLPETYSVIDILQRTKPPPLIVWETARRPADPILDAPTQTDAPARKQHIIDQLKQNLDTINEFSTDHPLWEQLDNMSQDSLEDFYRKLVDAFKTANQYVAAYNPPISYCTGAHNNAVLLGGDQQAKAATFYLCPYMGKLKFPLQDCLVILEQTLKHVKNFPSVAKDSGTRERTSKHILQRCLNRLNFQMELSGT